MDHDFAKKKLPKKKEGLIISDRSLFAGNARDAEGKGRKKRPEAVK